VVTTPTSVVRKKLYPPVTSTVDSAIPSAAATISTR
jgi:hypothetical protein